MTTTDVLILGGGVIGLAIGRELRRAGLAVTILERNARPGGEASWAAAGMLAPQSEADEPGPLLDLCLTSRGLYADFAAALHAETGIDIELRSEGTLLPAFSESEGDRLVERGRWQRDLGLRAEPLSAAAARGLEPDLSPNVSAALFLPDDRQVDNRRLTRSLIAAAYQAGVRIICDADGIELDITGNRVAGVTVSGERIAAPLVVNAAGSWAARMPAEVLRLPKTGVRPIRGQMLALELQPPGLLRHVVRTENVYLVPRRDGRLVVGATVEDAGFEKHTTAGGLAKLLTGAIEVVPALAAMTVTETWAGLRPLARDFLPIIGRTDVEGLLCATGHYRNGILLTPVTAKIIADLILGRPSLVPLDPFSPMRFQA